MPIIILRNPSIFVCFRGAGTISMSSKPGLQRRVAMCGRSGAVSHRASDNGNLSCNTRKQNSHRSAEAGSSTRQSTAARM